MKTPKALLPNSYETNLQMVKNYIHNHLEEELDLEKLSKISFISPFHFHRIFKSYFGFTPIDYLERTRLQAAIHLLKYTKLSVADVSFEVGFKNPETFHRSFRRITQKTPKQVRDANWNFLFETKPAKEQKTKVQFAEKFIPKTYYAYINYQSKQFSIGKSFRKLFDLSLQNGLLNATSSLISIWNYNQFFEYTSVDLGIFLKEKKNLKNMQLGFIPEGNYLEFTYSGELDNLDAVYRYIFREVIFQKNILLKPKPVLEISEKFPPFFHGKDCVSKILVPIH